MNTKFLAEDILKQATDVTEMPEKVQNRIKELKKVHQQIKDLQDKISEQVGDLQKQIKVLEKQSGIFEKEIMPELKTLQDHTIRAEGILIELKSGRRSPKVGYEFLASKVTSELITAAEEAMAKAAEFAQAPSIEVTSKMKTAGKALTWLIDKFKGLLGWARSLIKKNQKIESLIEELEGV